MCALQFPRCMKYTVQFCVAVTLELYSEETGFESGPK